MVYCDRYRLCGTQCFRAHSVQRRNRLRLKFTNRLLRPPALLLFSIFALLSVRTCDASDLALVDAKIYLSPTEPPIESGSILIHDGHIQAVGPTTTTKVPHGTRVLDCRGLVVTAGFWNSHVHIFTKGLVHAETHSSQELSQELQSMFTEWGFTTVFDIASTLQNTELIRRQIEAGEVTGPRILTVGEPFYIKGGTPFYIKDFLRDNHITLPEVESIPQAVQRVQQQIHDGADGIKIFANSVEFHGVLNMPPDVAKAIVTEAHRFGKPVFAHVSNDQGIQIALQSGVDILAHTTPADPPWDSSLVQRLVAAHMALTPTLTLWEVEFNGTDPAQLEKGMKVAAQQLGAFSNAGGQVLFGTDAGFMNRYDTSEEFKWMSRANMTYRQILASLTTSPSQRFGFSTHSGRIAKGFDADLVVLGADPALSTSAFSNVRYTIRAGSVIYAKSLKAGATN